MSIASQLTALQTDITNARTQITTMGGTVTVSGGSSQLATDISTIPTGGSGDLPIGSTITVTSDEGVTIEIERGTESQTSVVPSSGSVSFTVHQSGIWNITANKTGETELTDSVVVSADDTDYPVSMFWILYLYNAGDEYTSITGGWSARAWASDSVRTAKIPTLTKNASSMSISMSWGDIFGSGVIETINDIDLTRFNYLKASFSATSNNSEAIAIYVNDRNIAYWKTGGAGVSQGVPTSGYSGTIIADISSINSSKDVIFGIVASHYQANVSATITKIWLE